MYNMHKNSEIKFLENYEVFNIEELDDDKLNEVLGELAKKMDRLAEKNEFFNEFKNKEIGLIILGCYLSDAFTVAGCVRGLSLLAIPTMLLINIIAIGTPYAEQAIGNKIYSVKSDNLWEHRKRFAVEINKRKIAKEKPIEEKEIRKEIEELKERLDNAEISGVYQCYLRDLYLKELKERGVSEDILNMPGIQKIFNIALECERGNREFWLKEEELNKIDEKKFIIRTIKKMPYGCGDLSDMRYFKISPYYGREDDILVAETDERFPFNIYINKEGEISGISKKGFYQDIYVPYENTKSHTKTKTKKIKASK